MRKPVSRRSSRTLDLLRDWSLITGRGATKLEGGGGHLKVYPSEKGGGGRKCFSHAEGGGGGAQQVLG